MQLSIKQGLDIPLAGAPEGVVRSFATPTHVSLNLSPFEDLRFKVLIKTGDLVQIGQPLVENKGIPGQFFGSPAAGTIVEIRRGLKRRLLDVIIQTSAREEFFDHGTLELGTASREDILSCLMKGGIFPHIRMRPFDLIADPRYVPRDIFVKAVETAPYVPSAEMQVQGEESHFQIGLRALSKLTNGRVHLVYKEGTTCKAFTEAEGVETYAIRGPHPSGTSSVHIHLIRPIQKSNDYVWTLSTIDVIAVGKMVASGRYHYERVVSIAGNGILQEKRGFFKGRAGFPVSELIADRTSNSLLRLISGDPLSGMKVEPQDFLGFYHTTLSVLPENIQREPFHFLRAGGDKYSFHGVYLSGHLPPPSSGYEFTTSQHGEERPFIDGSIYNKVMPLRIPTMELIKAILAEDFELAETLGLLEIASEDFVLPTFICPSKIEMVEIVKQGLHRYSKEMGH